MTCPSCGFGSPAGMRFCGMCGTKLTHEPASRERRRVSSVFIDMAGFSTLTRDLDPEEMRDLADEVLTVVAGVVESYDGYVDALRGDGLIALFGAPHSHPDDPQRAVLAAAAALSAIEEVGVERGLPLKGRAGVNTGVVIAGAVGSGRVRSYTVMGSAVNLASRLEQAAEPGEVWVGPETYQATRHRLLYEHTGPIELRGFPNIKRAQKLVMVAGNRQTDPYAHVGFVGRDAELSVLQHALTHVCTSGTAHEMWLHGEAGSGKTRLLREFDARVAGRAATFWLKARPNEEFSWAPFGRQVFGLRLGEEERSAQRHVQSLLDELLPEHVRWHRLVLTSLDLAPPKSWTRLERRSVDRTALAWADLMAAIPGRPGGPEALVLFVENEPRDPVLLEFLALVSASASPVLVVRTTRSRLEAQGDADSLDAATAPQARPPVQALDLPPLTRSECLVLLAGLAAPTNREAAAALVDQVGGVPAHVLELGRALSITQEDTFSGSLASLLQARIDLLDPAPKRLLAHAALVGEVTWDGLLRELAGPGAAEDIRVLARENLILAQNSSAIPGEVEYRFQSDLVRNAALTMIPFADRPLLHLRIATWLEQFAPLAFAELTAAQFELGGSPDAAYAHYLAAADLACARGEVGATERLYSALLGLPVGPDTLAEGALAFAQAALTLGLADVAGQALARAEASIGKASGDVRPALQAVLDQLKEDALTLSR
ncbi:MAG: adenylate/guanylate cyclase domain-containing protein [Trueperaceae bacterium]